MRMKKRETDISTEINLENKNKNNHLPLPGQKLPKELWMNPKIWMNTKEIKILH
jgi:hypothetical protein